MFKHMDFINRGRYQRILLTATCIALASQVNIQVYTPGFILTLSVILLPIFLYFNGDLNPIELTSAVAIASPIFRGVLLLISNGGNIDRIFQYVIADMSFYFCYGILYYLLYWHRGQRNNSSFFATIVLCDYLSNLLEISLLIKFSNYSYKLFQLLFITALFRGLCSCLVAFLYHYFTLMLRNENHEQRYYHFIWIASSVKSEVYFMRKNINEIESVMKNAYLLNQDLQKNNNVSEKEGAMALDIARNVHDIKKDYQNVIRGLDDYFEGDDNNTAMQLADILKVVTNHTREAIKNRHRNILIEVHNQVDLVVQKHYYVVSILSNLIFNSVEAIKNDSSGVIRLTVEDDNNNIIINVNDNGIGMSKETAAMIFQPGFTTKFNENTGDVYRGIGLSHVKTIVKEQFDGNIKVNSKLGEGTNFQVILNKKRLEQGERI